MATNSVLPSYPNFTDIDGEPLEAGFLYVGVAGQDAETNPKNVFWDKAMTIAATQPVRTRAGYAQRNNAAAILYVDGDYSLTVKSRTSTLVYSSLNETVELGAAQDLASAAQASATAAEGFKNAAQTAVSAVQRMWCNQPCRNLTRRSCIACSFREHPRLSAKQIGRVRAMVLKSK